MMRRTWATMALVAVVATLGVGPVSSAMAQQADAVMTFDVNLKDADMVAATQMLTARTGLQFVIEPSDKPFQRITLRLGRVTPEEALRYITQAAGAYFRKDESGVYIISAKRPEEPKVAEVAPPPATRVIRRIKVRHSDARSVFNHVMGLSPFSANDVFEGINRFIAAGRLPGKGTIQAQQPQLLPQQPVFSPVSGRRIAPTVAAGESANDIQLPGETAGQMGGMGGGMAGGFGGQGGSGFGGGQPGGGGGGFGQGGAGGGNIQMQGGQGLIGESINYISYDPTDNSIVVRGTEEDIQRLQQSIALFDVRPRQVQIKVEFITTSDSRSRSLGFDWLYQRGAVFAGSRPGSFVRANDPVFLNYATGNITTRLRTLLQEGYGKTVNAPILRTLNNQPAIIQNSVTTSIILSGVLSAGNGQLVTTPQLQQITIQTSLGIAPRINDDGTITVFINTIVSDFGQVRRDPASGQEIPDTLEQQIQVVANVRNNETIALGGLTRKSEQGQQARWPVLGDLPIIGQFFRFTTNERNSSELLIFVTPSVIEDDDAAAASP